VTGKARNGRRKASKWKWKVSKVILKKAKFESLFEEGKLIASPGVILSLHDLRDCIILRKRLIRSYPNDGYIRIIQLGDNTNANLSRRGPIRPSRPFSPATLHFKLALFLRLLPPFALSSAPHSPGPARLGSARACPRSRPRPHSPRETPKGNDAKERDSHEIGVIMPAVFSERRNSPSAASCVPVRLRIRLWAFVLWLLFTLPNVVVTLVLYFRVDEQEERIEGGSKEDLKSASNATLLNDLETVYPCYDNLTVYLPIYEATRFWVEGVALCCVGVAGLCGNALTLAVLTKSKKTKFNKLLVHLSVTDCVLIVFFLLLSSFTVLASEPQW